MCKGAGYPTIAMCACGASFASCDTVEALCHITQNSSNCHSWVFINTGVWTAGRIIDPKRSNPTDYKKYLLWKYRMAREALKALAIIVVFLSSIAPTTVGATRIYGHRADIASPYVGHNHLLECCRGGWFIYLGGFLYTVPGLGEGVKYIRVPLVRPSSKS